MNIFSSIEGLAGENFGSALLSYLIFNSDEVRDAVIALLSDNAPSGPLSYNSHFACRTEYRTTHSEFGDGRLDILIQLDDVVIGIENKFYADFQSNQPIKYIESLKSIASALASINRTEVRSLLYVLCPASRGKEARQHLEKYAPWEIGMAVITWEEVMACMERVRDVSNPVAQIVMTEFITYLKRRFSFIHEFDRKAVHLNRAFPEFGTPLQTELVNRLWPMFPAAGGRISNGKTWLGYYFYTDPAFNQKGWFGFVPRREIASGNHREAELIVAATVAPALDGDFVPIRLSNSEFIGKVPTHAWRIDFDDRWNSVEIWRKKLAPFWTESSEDVAR
jgi:hypothetical protein